VDGCISTSSLYHIAVRSSEGIFGGICFPVISSIIVTFTVIVIVSVIVTMTSSQGTIRVRLFSGEVVGEVCVAGVVGDDSDVGVVGLEPSEVVDA
jgi:hypothetical protein